MILSPASLIGVCAFLLLPVPDSAITKSQSLDVSPSLERLLTEARKSRQDYVEAFKNLTAVETKLTEVFDKDGMPSKQRTVIADLIVYQSQIDPRFMSEYRVIREVDGKSVSNHTKRAENFFTELVRAKTLKDEFKRLREENMRHTLRYFRWDVTLHPAWQLEEKALPYYNYELAGREKVGGKETIIISYNKRSLFPAKAKGILSDFKAPLVSDRGRVWLDAKTYQIYRWENEQVVRHSGTGKILVFMRDEVDYVKIDLGILVPKRIVVSFLDRLKDGKEPSTLLGGRITYSYDSFKRFNVTSQEEVHPIEKN